MIYQKEMIDKAQRADIKRIEMIFASIDPLTACTLNYAKQLLKYSPVNPRRAEAVDLLKEVLNLAGRAKVEGIELSKQPVVKTEKRGK